MIIDAYSHISPDELLEVLATSKSEKNRARAAGLKRWIEVAPQFCDPEIRISHMDKYHIDMQVMTVMSHSAPNNEQDPADMLRVCQVANDSMAAIADKYKNRLISVGMIPFLALNEGGLDEMDRGMKSLGLKGFVVSTHINGKPLDSPEFFPFFERAAQLEAAVFIHPIDPYSFVGRTYEKDYDLSHVFGWPFETTLALSRLIFSGILDKLPSLKLVSHHLGAMIPFFADRITWSYDEEMREEVGITNLKKPLMDYFKLVYHDTAVEASLPALSCGVKVFGCDRIVFATDYPHGSHGGVTRLEKFPGSIEALEISREDKLKIFEKNSKCLLGMS